jgi:hypothetical protein
VNGLICQWIRAYLPVDKPLSNLDRPACPSVFDNADSFPHDPTTHLGLISGNRPQDSPRAPSDSSLRNEHRFPSVSSHSAKVIPGRVVIATNHPGRSTNHPGHSRGEILVCRRAHGAPSDSRTTRGRLADDSRRTTRGRLADDSRGRLRGRLADSARQFWAVGAHFP